MSSILQITLYLTFGIKRTKHGQRMTRSARPSK